MLPLLLFIISLVYGIPIQTIYIIIIISPLLKSNLNTPSYNKLIAHFGITTSIGVLLSFVVERFPTIVAVGNPSFHNLFQKLSSPHWLLDVLFLLRIHAFAMTIVNGIWLFFYRLTTILFPNDYERIFKYPSVTICLPTFLLPFVASYPLWMSLNNFFYIKSPHGYYVPYFTQEARVTLHFLSIFQISCIQIVGVIIFLIVAMLSFKGKLLINKILVLRAVYSYVVASIPIWFEFFMINKDRSNPENETLFLFQPLVQDIGYLIQPVLLLIFNRHIREIVAQILRLEGSGSTKQKTISLQPQKMVGKPRSSTQSGEKERRNSQKTKRCLPTINITAPIGSPNSNRKHESQ